MSGSEDQSAEDLKELGNKAFAAKKFQEAIDLYTKAIQKDPRNHVFYSNRSASFAGLKQWQKAVDDAKECIRRDPNFIKGYYRLALAQIELGESDKALATVRQGLNIDQNNSQLTKQMNMILQSQKIAAAKEESAKQAMTDVPVPRATTQLDEATSSELQDLQLQYVQANREIQMNQVNISRVQREGRVGEITKAELQTLPDEAHCYRSVGKMFLCTTKNDAMGHVDSQIAHCKKAESDMNGKIEYLKKQVDSIRQNINELIALSAGN